jgi:hypothetical protein
VIVIKLQMIVIKLLGGKLFNKNYQTLTIIECYCLVASLDSPFSG